MEKFVSTLNDIVWNPGLVGLLLVAGLYFSVRTRLVQVRRFKLMLRSLIGKKQGNNAEKRTGRNACSLFLSELT